MAFLVVVGQSEEGRMLGWERRRQRQDRKSVNIDEQCWRPKALLKSLTLK